MKKLFTSNAILLSTLILASGSASGQAENNSVFQNATPNFYVTTPQTGEQTAVGGQANTSGQSRQSGVANRSQNTYSNRSTRQNAVSTANSGYTVTTPQETTNAYGSQQNYAQTGQPAQYSTSHSSHQHVASSSAASQQTVQQTTYPSYVAHSTEDRKGLLSRLLHKKSGGTPAQPVQAVQVSNNSIKTSKLNGTVQSGTASWYGNDFHGGKTANGERYNMESLTAAHKTLPFGTIVKVRNERNGQECVVRINNRGPFIRGRILDVSKAAARQLGMVSSGVAKISMQVIGRS